MLIGVGRIVLDYYGNQNASKKHKELEALCEGLRKKFNISAMEIASFDDPERCVMGFAVVIPETWKSAAADSFVQKICEEIDTTAFARVVVEDWDVLAHGTFDDDDASEKSPEAREIARRLKKSRREE